MSQTLRPNSTISEVTWTANTGVFHEAVDDVVADDAATIIIHTVGGSVTDAEVGLSSVTDPESDADHVVHVRWFLDIAAPLAAPNDLTVSLYEGASLIAQDTFSPTAETWEGDSFTLSGAEADSITDYSALSVRLNFNYGGIGGELWITQIYMEVPDAPAPPGESFEIREHFRDGGSVVRGAIAQAYGDGPVLGRDLTPGGAYPDSIGPYTTETVPKDILKELFE